MGGGTTHPLMNQNPTAWVACNMGRSDIVLPLRVESRCEVLHPFRQISHMSTLLSGVVFGEINWPIFPRRQFLIEGVVKAFIWINTECLIIKVENQVTTIPNGRVPSESYYSPRPRHVEFHVMPNWPSHLFVALR